MGWTTALKAIEGAIPVVLPNRAMAVRQALPEGTDILTLQVRSVPTSLAGWLPAPTGTLIGIASSWPGFLKLARTILQAAGFHSDALVFRDARKSNWQRGLQQTAAVVCDSVTATLLPTICMAIPFPFLSETSIAELQRYVEFIQNPLHDPGLMINTRLIRNTMESVTTSVFSIAALTQNVLALKPEEVRYEEAYSFCF